MNENIKNDIADKYIERKINKNTIANIKKATKEEAFKNIPEEKVEECVDQIIEYQSKDRKTVKEIVNENSLRSKYTKNTHLIMHNLILKLLAKVERILSNRYYVDHLSKSQKAQLIKRLQRLNQFLKPSVELRDFPKKNIKIHRPEK